jgi:hypothetical protein
MAILTTKGLSGQIGKQLVFKARGGKTIVSAYVEPRQKKATELQQLFRDCFRRAQKRASRDSRKAEIKDMCSPYLKEGQSVYHFLMGLYHREEIRMMKRGVTMYENIKLLLPEEPKRVKEVVKHETSKIEKNINRVWSYPIQKTKVHKVDYRPKACVWINRPFYGGWVSTMS